MESHNRDIFNQRTTKETELKNINQELGPVTNNTINVCHFCDAEFSLSSELDDHLKDKHKSEKCPFKCKECGRLFSKLSGFKSHLNSHKKKSYNCNLCRHKFAEEKTLLRHRKTMHALQQIECKICSKKFTKKKLYRYHLKTHDTDKKYKCQYCPKQFLQSHHLADHERTHTGEKPFLCPICAHRFRIKMNLDQHIAMKHGDYKKPYECNECDKKYTTKTQLKNHMKQNHSDERLYQCETCGKKFSNQLYLSLHEKRHIVKTQCVCDLCGLSFGANITLNNHMHKEHNIFRPNQDFYPCQLCNKFFRLPSTLDTHMKLHDEERLFACNECDDTFRNEKNLSNHINVVHRNNKPHKCDVSNKKNDISDFKKNKRKKTKDTLLFQQCTKRFLFPSQLREHMTKHTGEFPYECTMCTNKYRLKKSLDVHMRNHTGEKPHQCKYCDERFKDYPVLRNHLNANHKDEILSYQMINFKKDDDNDESTLVLDKGVTFETIEFLDDFESEDTKEGIDYSSSID